MKKTNLDYKLKKLNSIIASHIFATGPALDLEEYLQTKVNHLLFIGHYFAYSEQKNSFYRFYKNNKLKKENKSFELKLPQLLMNLKDIFYTFYWIIIRKEKFHFYIGSDSLMAFLGLILKVLGKVDNVILYTIDYMPQRFNNFFLNWLYHFFDKVCLRYCKIIWNVSPNMAKAREKFDKIKISESVPQIVVPLGVWHNRIPKLSLKQRIKNQIVFMGHLIDKQGVDLVIKSMPAILNKIPDTKLLIIGSGESEKKLKELSFKLKLDKVVKFSGFVKDHKEVEKMLSESMVAVAMYKPDPTSFTNWSDPGKLKNYLSAGLPIFLTKVPHLAYELQEKECAFVISYNPQKLSQKIVYLLQHKKLLQEYSRNAINFAKEFDWNKVFMQALAASL